ncbi:MAG: 3-hydroxybenzoate 6-monooxygenase [Alphaproteobacteria bacterium]|nr:3-hydroxybenzoate 6-monooxygenase [Alphaproteobacteria bacterium]
MANDRVLIAGGGIGGLTSALALAAKGFDVTVMERASKFGEIGAGIQLGPNAFHALDTVGVGAWAREKAVFVDMLRLMDAVGGEEIIHIPLDAPFRTRFGNPYAVIHRGDLHGVLLKGCEEHPRIELRPGTEVVSYEQDGDAVRAIPAAGDPVDGAILIGADGLRSHVRAKVVGDGEPRVSGHSTYRAVIPLEKMPEDLRWNAATLWAGPKCHIVHYPLSDWKYFNLVITKDNDAREAATGKPVSRESVRAQFMHVSEKIRRVIETGDDWKVWVLCDREPVGTWVDGHVALLGDAAHPTLQYYAQGACMAMEDSVCLAHMLDSHRDDPHAGLVAYQEARVVRTARVQLGSRAIGELMFHAEGVHARVRDEIMRNMTTEDYYDRLAWLYGETGLSGLGG